MSWSGCGRLNFSKSTTVHGFVGFKTASTAILANSWPGRIASLCCLCGLAIAFFGALAGLLASLWIRSRSVRPSEATLGLYGLLAQKLGQATPPLLVSHRIKSPALVGLGSRFIVLPSNLDRPESRARLELSLLHELAHDQSWDPLFSFLGGMTKSIWFFLPTAWWIVRQMRLDQEYMADSRNPSIRTSRSIRGFALGHRRRFAGKSTNRNRRSLSSRVGAFGSRDAVQLVSTDAHVASMPVRRGIPDVASLVPGSFDLRGEFDHCHLAIDRSGLGQGRGKPAGCAVPSRRVFEHCEPKPRKAHSRSAGPTSHLPPTDHTSQNI